MRMRSLFLLLLWPAVMTAAVPVENNYQVKLRHFAAEPTPQQFTISGHDQAILVKPTMASYTQFNPLDRKAIYTLPPYPDTERLPRLGQWMTVTDLDARPIYLLSQAEVQGSQAPRTLVPAHWISLTNPRGQYIIEPINYVFIVYPGKQPAVAVLQAALRQAGFSGTASNNHSGGYSAYIGGQLFGQLTTPQGAPLTYSNQNFQVQNDHFRIFGAYPLMINKKTATLFTASISEESGLESRLMRLPPKKRQAKLVALSKQHSEKPEDNYGHHFVAFSCARNNLAVGLIKAGFPTYYASMGNIVNTARESTEDHDGNVYLTVISG